MHGKQNIKNQKNVDLFDAFKYCNNEFQLV
jgi:hypothetical protein